jgi:hypothetical protein
VNVVVDWAQVVAAVANVGSLIFVAWQVRGVGKQTEQMTEQSRQAVAATRAAVNTNRQDSMMRLTEIFVDHPELRRRFYGPVPRTSADELEDQRAAAVAEMFLDLMDTVFTDTNAMSDGEDDPWKAYFADMMRTSDTLRAFWTERRDWYCPEMNEFLDAEIAQDSAASIPRARQSADAVVQP